MKVFAKLREINEHFKTPVGKIKKNVLDAIVFGGASVFFGNQAINNFQAGTFGDGLGMSAMGALFAGGTAIGCYLAFKRINELAENNDTKEK